MTAPIRHAVEALVALARSQGHIVTVEQVSDLDVVAVRASAPSGPDPHDRAGFEAAGRDAGWSGFLLKRWPDGRYMDEVVQAYWSGWQWRGQAPTDSAAEMVRDIVKVWDGGPTTADEYRDAMTAIEERMRKIAAGVVPRHSVTEQELTVEENHEIAYAQSGYRHFFDFSTFKAFRADCAAAAKLADVVCPACKGSGEGTGLEGAGPDTYEVPRTCSACDGSGEAPR